MPPGVMLGAAIGAIVEGEEVKDRLAIYVVKRRNRRNRQSFDAPSTARVGVVDDRRCTKLLVMIGNLRHLRRGECYTNSKLPATKRQARDGK